MKSMVEEGKNLDPLFIHKVLRARKWFVRIGLALCLVFMVAAIALAIILGTQLGRGGQCKGGGAACEDDVHRAESPSQPPVWPPTNEGYLGNFTRAAVAADNGICSEIGRNIMIRGGNAIDSTIATVLCVGVMDSHSSGIGGGHFMTIYNSTSKTCLIIDAREEAPSAAAADMYVNNSKWSQIGWLAAGVPGEIHGLYTAYKLGGSGRISWRDLVTPAADLCRYGYPVSGALAKAIANQKSNIMKEETLKSLFINKQTGQLYEVGEIMHRPLLAETLYSLANAPDPIQWFYNSNVTQAMADEFQRNGGIITVDDFRRYSAKYGSSRPALTMKIGEDLVACGPPPPSSAAVTLAILNILEGYGINKSKLENFDFQLETYHRLLESMKFAYGSRMQLGDMDYVDKALDVAKNITKRAYGRAIRNRITDQAHLNRSYYWDDRSFSLPDDHGTAHVSVVDQEGNAVAITTTINLYFGARVRSLSTGIIWNDQMDDFSNPAASNYFNFLPAATNLVEPGKRPLSSMSPLVIYNTTSGQARIVVGSAGGSRIISTIAQLVMRLLWFGEDVRASVESPRLHNQLDPFQSEFEPGFPKAYLDKLIEKGHNFTDFGTFSTASTAIYRSADDGHLYANSDYRKAGGYPAGY